MTTELWFIDHADRPERFAGPYLTVDEAAARLRVMPTGLVIARGMVPDEVAIREIERQTNADPYGGCGETRR